jgi:hypothetical protein
MAERKRIPVGEMGKEFGEVISPEKLKVILGLKSRKTIDVWTAAGRLDGCFRKRGRYNLIVRKLALDRILNGPEWKNEQAG